MKFLLEEAREESAAVGFCGGNLFGAVLAVAPLACGNRSLDLCDVLATTSPCGLMAYLAFNWTAHVLSCVFVDMRGSCLQKNIPGGVLSRKWVTAFALKTAVVVF